MKKKLIKSLLPIASCVAIVAPIVCLTSCAEDEDVDNWDGTNNRLMSDFIQLPIGDKRYEFEIEYEDWQPGSWPWSASPSGEFLLVPWQTTSEISYEFQINKITLNKQKLSIGQDYTISVDKKTITLQKTITESLSPAAKLYIDVTIKTSVPLGVAFVAK